MTHTAAWWAWEWVKLLSTIVLLYFCSLGMFKFFMWFNDKMYQWLSSRFPRIRWHR